MKRRRRARRRVPRGEGFSLSFHGAAGTVTGSRHLLRTPEATVLVDAGLFQGLKELRLLNWAEPAFDPLEIDHLVLTHAHIDHAGYLPRLVRQGYDGPVHCTQATRELAEILLVDAAKIQEEDARYANRKRYSKHRPALPLFTKEDASEALRLLRPVRYGDWFALGERTRARFLNAGHILGSALVDLRLEQGGRERSIVFSGDVGQYDMPLHPDPTPPPHGDALVVESTYGDREHDETPFLEQIRRPFLEAMERGGTVLVPSFAVARAQVVCLLLREAMKSGRLPEVPVHIDSPMAVDATEVYSRHLDLENLDPDLVAEGRVRLFPREVRFHRSVKQSKALNDLEGPRVILSASGMLTAGRVLHHLRRLLPDPRNLVALVGYQAAGTRGRALLEGAKSLRMHGRDVPVRAECVALHGLSAHADRSGLLRWVRSMRRPPATVFVTHGEPEASRAFAELLGREIGARVSVPSLGETFDLAGLLEDGP